MGADFSGYATKAGLKCSDGRTIMPDAFKHMDKMILPLVWQHGHNDPKNVLGHAVLENRPDGVYAYGYFNETDNGQHAKQAVKHEDIKAMSIFANRLTERSKQVFHGNLVEVSLVMAGANPGAFIDVVNIQHGDDIELDDDAAVIFTGLEFEHTTVSEDDDENLEHADVTARAIYDSMTDDQKELAAFMVAAALESKDAVQHSDVENKDEETNEDEDAESDNSSNDNLSHQEDSEMTHRNVFDTDKKNDEGSDTHVLSHSDMLGIFTEAEQVGSLKKAVETYALKHGITNLDVLFPEAQALTATPEWDKRRTDWVDGVLSGTRKTPFARVKTWTADLNFDDARAKGYITGNLKKEEFFSLAQRETSPQTIYKKQKLDRDDIIDLTFDIVPWMRGEMRLMLNEELAGAILVGDGRSIDDEDKIREDKIRPIVADDDLYCTKITFPITDLSTQQNDLVDQLILARVDWHGTGVPTMYTSEEILTTLLLTRDGDDRRMYRTVEELASELRVDRIVVIDVLDRRDNLLAIIVNLADYTVGANRGGEVTLFDDFDIDYNQYKYLIETRVSGALAKFKSALAIFKVANSDTVATPTKPAFDKTTNTITIPTVTGVQYSINGVNKTNGMTIVITENTYVDAKAKSGYYTVTSRNRWAYTVQDI